MSMKIRRTNATLAETRFADLVDLCSLITVKHGEEKQTGDWDAQEVVRAFTAPEFSITYRRFGFSYTKQGMPYFAMRMVVRSNKKVALDVSGKAHGSANFDLKTNKYVRDSGWEDAVRDHVYLCDACCSNAASTVSPTPFRQKIEELTTKCILLADRRGKLVSKRNDPFACGVQLEFTSPKLKIFCSVLVSPYSNGSCNVVVHSGKKLVFKASGCYGIGAYRVKEEAYVPGSWEEEVGLEEPKDN